MLDSKQYPVIAFYNALHSGSIFTEVLQKIGQRFCYLICPTDTTERPGSRKYHLAQPKGGIVKSSVKLICWVVIAITVALILGQLQ